MENNEGVNKKILEELGNIKGLLTLLAIKNGASSDSIADVLNISVRSVQRMVPIKSIKTDKTK